MADSDDIYLSMSDKFIFDGSSGPFMLRDTKTVSLWRDGEQVCSVEVPVTVYERIGHSAECWLQSASAVLMVAVAIALFGFSMARIWKS